MEIVEKTIDVKVRILPNINTYLVMLVSTVAMANSTPAIIMTKNSTFININMVNKIHFFMMTGNFIT